MLLPQLQRVHLPKGKVLWELGDKIGYAYFLEGGMASLLSLTSDGETVEVAMVGNDGVLGIECVLQASTVSHRTMILMPTDAFRIKVETLRTVFDHSAELRSLLLQYTRRLLGLASQSAVCHRFHTATQRLARRLLMASDRMDSDTITLTQELIASMLGIPRTGVTMAAAGLQEAGAIRQRHGRIQILDRRRLLAAACECYSAARVETGSFPPARVIVDSQTPALH
jgi:CRP-like cAMP-binding protein